MVAQAACLARIDMVTPVFAVIVAMVCNIIGDYMLCIKPFQFGLNGAAAATALATIMSTAILVLRLRKDQKALLDGNAPLLTLPPLSDQWKLCKLAGPIFFVMVGKVTSYSMMTLKATSHGIISLASHTVLLRVFFFFTIFGDALSQTAQSYLPRLIYGSKNESSEVVNIVQKTIGTNIGSDAALEMTISANVEHEHTQETSVKLNGNTNGIHEQNHEAHSENNGSSNEIYNDKVLDISGVQHGTPSTSSEPAYRLPTSRSFLSRLFALGFGISVIFGPLATLVTQSHGEWFTKDGAILKSMASVAHWMGTCLMIHPFVMIDEGILIARQDLIYLVFTYMCTIGFLGLQLRRSTGIIGVWQALLVFQVSRLIQFRSRVWLKRGKSQVESK
mmetsp:Transcript_17723/g.40174  ORF Transcript_17723/g.40174 Transcript_17723/m.40174 type:complete len:390 (+) Transcript_17723:1261-2430(+)